MRTTSRRHAISRMGMRDMDDLRCCQLSLHEYEPRPAPGHDQASRKRWPSVIVAQLGFRTHQAYKASYTHAPRSSKR